MHVKEGESSWSNGVEQTPVATLPPLVHPLPRSARSGLPAIMLHGIRLNAIDEQACIDYILTESEAGRGGVVVTPNVDHLRRCRQDVSFSALVAEADLVVADGMPLIWASRLQATPLPQRVAGSDLISSLSRACAAKGKSIYLLGGDPGTAEAAAKVLSERNPQLKIAGTLCPVQGFENDEERMQEIIFVLQSARPDVVFVALGSPKQERVIDRIRRTMPRTWWLGVGVSFSFLSGTVRRAPVWMRKCGLEWVHRLAQEPRRLFKRYVVVGLPFATHLLGRAAVRGIRVRFFNGQPEAVQTTDLGMSDILSAERQIEIVRSENGEAQQSADEIAARLVREPSLQELANPPSAIRGRLRGLILLGGGVRPTRLGMAVGRSVLDLPVGNGKTVLTRWLDEAAEVAKAQGMDQLPVRLLVDRNAIEPVSHLADQRQAESYRLERDQSEYRGTGGLLANIAVDYQDEDIILVGNAAQVLLDPLAALLASLRKTRGVVSVIGHREGEPSGLMLITCKALRLIPKDGFVDMKEQALPFIASNYDVRVVQCRRPTGLPIRSLSDYISALRALHQPVRIAVADPWAEDWRSTFAVIEPGANVSSSARIHDSVILSGGTVEAGAVVVRSVVAGTVRKDRKAVDQCVESTYRPAGFPVAARSEV